MIAGIVDRLDVSALYCAYSGQGGDAFDPATMLSIWLFAYTEGQTSTRRVEQLCRRDLHYIYVSSNLNPDHCSLSRFQQRHVEILPELFSQVVRLAQEEGLASFKRISVDGSKIEASASSKANRNKEKFDKELVRVCEEVKDYLRQCDQEDGIEGAKNAFRNLAGLVFRSLWIIETLLSHFSQLFQTSYNISKR